MKIKYPKIEIGMQFDDMKIVKEVSHQKCHSRRYLVECQICHRQKELSRVSFNSHRGLTHKSCGQGLKTKDKRFHNIWCGIRQRTNNPNYEHWDCYGGRGINSDEFENFIDFYDAMYDSYIEAIEYYKDPNSVSIDRIDVNGNYCKNNCRWISISEQKSNTRYNKFFLAISPDKKEFISNNQRYFGRCFNLSDKQINACLMQKIRTHRGWTFRFIEKCNDYPNAIPMFMAIGVGPTDNAVGG